MFLLVSMWNYQLLSLQFVGNKAKVLQENTARQIFRKTSISYPLIRTRACAYQGGKKCSFFGKIGVLCFLVAPFSRFALLRYCQRINVDTLGWRQQAHIKCIDRVINPSSVSEVVISDGREDEQESGKNECAPNVIETLQMLE